MISNEIKEFLACETPAAWLEAALRNQDTLLIDHANCEKKAAATAMSLLYRYSEHTELLRKMSQLAREELLHFEQVVNLMAERNIAYIHLGPARYASGLREHLRKDGKHVLVDTLIVGAFVEARSCERFARLVPLLDPVLAKFYRSLLRSESRHYEDYLALAALYSEEDITSHVQRFREIERALIESPDPQFRFHSGVPVASAA
ncbi:MAG: tRNA-(ms[2]io[6]A)-hydroxylase [Pseudomonadales bacterium]|nr:tRNA-(ms[2]io[6]A)-hydroxylase [Pseudomonadales bacterium]MCP5331417.1 tRNA-(ms[2]io[6]A)-hydroxylase [Pseudomonadales bacterium]MCP5344426.1 tRNA-(ms[2]io[6]A)-hydroxylase [Pseudomonadales bacterium]